MNAYFKLLALLAVLALVMALPDVAAISLFFTLGLALPLIFSATILAYALCAGPFVALCSDRWRDRLAGAGLSVLAVAGVGLLPGWLGKQQAARAAHAYLATDHAPDRPVEGVSLEIRRPANDHSGYFSDSHACGGECRAVLSEGRVKWLRVMVEDGSGSPATRMRYQLSASPECSAGTGKLLDASCMETVDDAKEPADIELSVTQGPRFKAKPGTFDLVKLDRTAVVVAQERRDGKLAEVYRQTEVDVSVAMTPTVIGPEFGGGGVPHSRGVQIVRREKRINRLSVERALKALGLLGNAARAMPVVATANRDWRSGVDDAMTAQVVQVLRLSQSEPFNREQARVVGDWIMHARQTAVWSQEQIAVLRRIVRDRRLTVPTFFDQLFERKPEIARALLPDVLELLEAHGIGANYTPERQAAYMLPRVDARLVEPYGQRIVALMGRSEDLKAILIPTVGRIGIDPLTFLLPFEADLDKKISSYASQHPRVQGACRAEARWAQSLVPELRKAAVAVRDADKAPQAYEVALLKALYNLGDREFVDAQLVSRSSDAVDRLQRELARAVAKPDPAGFLCSG